MADGGEIAAAAVAAAAGDNGVGGGARREGVVAGLMRVKRKAGALMREPSPSKFSLEALEVDDARLRLWVRV